MSTFQVQLYPAGRWDRLPWRQVNASDEADAAFKATGERFAKSGPHGKVRVRVMSCGNIGERLETLFYAK